MTYVYNRLDTTYDASTNTKTMVWSYRNTSISNPLLYVYKTFTGTEIQLIAFLQAL